MFCLHESSACVVLGEKRHFLKSLPINCSCKKRPHKRLGGINKFSELHANNVEEDVEKFPHSQIETSVQDGLPKTCPWISGETAAQDRKSVV